MGRQCGHSRFSSDSLCQARAHAWQVHFFQFFVFHFSFFGHIFFPNLTKILFRFSKFVKPHTPGRCRNTQFFIFPFFYFFLVGFLVFLQDSLQILKICQAGTRLAGLCCLEIFHCLADFFRFFFFLFQDSFRFQNLWNSSSSTCDELFEPLQSVFTKERL